MWKLYAIQVLVSINKKFLEYSHILTYKLFVAVFALRVQSSVVVTETNLQILKYLLSVLF